MLLSQHAYRSDPPQDNDSRMDNNPTMTTTTDTSDAPLFQCHTHTDPAVLILSLAMALLILDPLGNWPSIKAGKIAESQRVLTALTLVGILATVTLNVVGWLCFGDSVLGVILLVMFVGTFSVFSMILAVGLWYENMERMAKTLADGAKGCCRVCRELERAEDGEENALSAQAESA